MTKIDKNTVICEELQKALYSPINPFIKWGVFGTFFIMCSILLLSFEIYTTSTQTITTSYETCTRRNDSIYISFIVLSKRSSLFIGDKVSVIEDKNDCLYLGKVIETNFSKEREYILVQTDSLRNFKSYNVLSVSNRQSIGKIISSYIQKEY